MAKKTRNVNVRHSELTTLHHMLDNNVYAMKDGPQRKKWTKHDILPIQPLTETQRDMFQAYYQGSHVIAHGCPGTGKTMLAIYLALQDVVDPQMAQTKIKIIRSAVPSREIGHLPGTEAEKMMPYEAPYQSILHMLGKRPSTYQDMKEAGLIQFIPTSFVRGTTWDDTIVIIDEAQNMTWHELNSVVTRIGDNSRLIVTGDTKQCDLVRRNDISGFAQFINVSTHVKAFTATQFTVNDIVRSDFVKDWIIACERVGV